MNLNKTHLTYVNSIEKFNTMLTDGTKSVQDVYFPTDGTCAMQWKHENGFMDEDKQTNIFLAAFTTCHARLKLYKELDKLQKDVLYMDTDSIVYASNGQNDPPLGNYLGDFTDELNGETIKNFVSGGPKNYAFITDKGTNVCKVRGFTLNYKNSLLINFDVMDMLVGNFDQETTVNIVNPTKICRDTKRRRVYNRQETKSTEWCTPSVSYYQTTPHYLTGIKIRGLSMMNEPYKDMISWVNFLR